MNQEILESSDFNISNIIKETVALEFDSIFKEDVLDSLKKIENDHEMVNFLMDTDPRNEIDYFWSGYKVWANQDKGSLGLLTYKSKIANYLGTFVYGSPESQGMPFYFYYSTIDKIRSAPNHFNNIEDSTYEEHRYRLFVNRYSIYLRRKTSKWLALFLVSMGLFMGLVGKPMVDGVKHQVALSKQVSNVENEVDSQIANVKKLLSERKAEITVKAKALKESYASGNISAEDFNAQATEIKIQDKKLDQAAEESITRIKASGEKNIANIKDKGSEETTSINADMEKQLEEIKQKYSN
ncbi:hypothetical protein SAMN05192566_0729 [Methylophilus rhizosphaerae]|uniref:Uncharacterized protein n=1 Tax=Methylophilus rhizosphaerae TaxID=492660 RepID=A0A1G9A8V4_9PROT|nr:hypothetical protein [Methylophilus rhizosphaerae]SDK23254.1 hypothetical protein SAMN05192566_0729 [Methylophilus rhizosphaerae]